MACPDQSFDCDEFTLEIREMTVSPTTIRATIYYHMTEELLAACQSSEKLMLPPAIFSESGVECAYAGSYESMEEDGKVLTVEYSNHGISEEDDTCTLVTKLRDYASGEEYEIAAESTVKLR